MPARQNVNLNVTVTSLVAAALLGAAACATPETSAASSALTIDDVDIAPECAGVLRYANTASFATLDAFLPSDVAQAIVATAAIDPFASIADLLAVHGLGATRLQHVLTAARSAGFVGASCDGIHDNLAVSSDDAAALLGFVNGATRPRLQAVLAFLPFPVPTVGNLLAGRPYATAAAIAATEQVGPATFRALRNAAISRAFQELADAVNAVERFDPARIFTQFDVPALFELDERGSVRFRGIVCFGMDPAELPPGTTIRSGLADAAEVQAHVVQAVAHADRSGEVSAQVDPTLGLANLQTLIAGRSFRGCFLRLQDGPFVFDSHDFFLDTASSFRVLTTVRGVE